MYVLVLVPVVMQACGLGGEAPRLFTLETVKQYWCFPSIPLVLPSTVHRNAAPTFAASVLGPTWQTITPPPPPTSTVASWAAWEGKEGAVAAAATATGCCCCCASLSQL